MSEFISMPEMDWLPDVETGVEGGVSSHLSKLDSSGRGPSHSAILENPTQDLESGFRVIETKEPRSRRLRPFEVPEGDRYVCLWEGCKSRNPTFGREAELQRHYSTQHVRSERFHCLAAVCIARDSKGFARLDKLQEHLRTYHHKDTLFMCPVTECDAGPLPPDLLHIHYHGHSVDIKNDADKKWTGYMSCCHNTCPLQGCDKLLATRFKEQYFPLHRVFHHDRHARSANASAILSAGYNPLSGWPLCPVCMIELENGWWGSYEEHFSGHEFELLHNHRRDILKIAPYFGERKAFQPVFADIMPTVARREGLD